MSQCADIRRSLGRKCAGLGIPVNGVFELTPRCNLRCRMCYVRLDPEEMVQFGSERTTEQWLELARQARDSGMVFLLLTGGEPTLRSDFCELYEALAQMGLSISINTNGTLITPQLRRLWHRLPPAQVNITLYGTERGDYDALCGNPNAFDAVVDALDWLQEEGILVHLNTTIVPTNHYKWEQLEAFAKARSLDLRMTVYCFPPTRRDKGCFQRLAPEEAGALLVKDILYREGPESIMRKALDLDTPLPKTCEQDIGSPIQCLAGRSQFWVTWQGEMTPCAMLTTPVTHPFRDRFDAAWEELKEQCRSIRLCSDCSSCPDQKSCMNCAAVTFAETGDFSRKPEYMCSLNRTYRKTLLDLAEQLRHN